MPESASAPAVPPKEIAFSADLPRTCNGKIMLRARELGLPEGDLSTLEDAASTERIPGRGVSGDKVFARPGAPGALNT